MGILEYLRGIITEHKPYIYIVLLAFIIGFITGLLTPPEVAGSYVLSISEKLMPLAEKAKPRTFMGALIIFLNNWVTAVIVFVVNVVAPIIVGYNGWILGIFASYMNSKGLILTYILGVIPHGILEIPALILAGASGLRFGRLLVGKLYYKLRGKKYSIGLSVEGSLKLLATSIVMFLIAALIEAFITPTLISPS